MKKQIIKILLLLLLPFTTLAQQPLNLNFEKLSVEGIKRPWGWDVQNWWNVAFKMDNVVVKKGRYSLHAACRNENELCAKESPSYELEPLDFRNKKVTFIGSIKGESLEDTVGFSIFYSFSNNESIESSEKEISSKAYTGTFDWQEEEVSLDFPENLERVILKLNYKGSGEAWFDDFKILIEEEAMTQLNVAKAFSEENINWLIQNAASFESPLPKENEFNMADRELLFFKKAVGNSRIVALGESTHGTSEFFSLKHKLFQYAVIELGFRVFVLEDHQLFTQNIDHYVKTGEGTAINSLRDCFGTWDRAEIVNMIQWIRDYNVKHPEDMISVIGVDVQSVIPSIDSLSSFLKQKDIALYNAHQTTLSDLKEKGRNYFMFPDTSMRLEWIKSAEHIHGLICLKKETWLSTAKNKTDTLFIEYGLQYANLVQQYFKEILSNGMALYRDEAMATNVSWYLEKIHPDAKFFIWAHDVHISRGDHERQLSNLHNGVSMGSFLSKKYKDDYKSFGISTYEGSFLAFKTYSYLEQIEAPLFKSPKGSLEEAMHQVAKFMKSDNLFFTLHRDQPWLNERIPIRFANHVNIDYGYWTRYSIPYQFDGIFYIDQTTSARNN